MNAKAYWVGFNMVRGIGAVRMRALLDFFGDLQTAWNAPEDGLQNAGLPVRIIDNLKKIRRDVDLERIWNDIQERKIQVITWEDGDYPRRLKEIPQSPPVLYMRGSIQAQDEWAVAIVGTRRMTPYGRQVTEELAAILAKHGVTIVSGLARGVDAAAHQTALKMGGRTLAVLGSGVDRVYPPEHRKLADELSDHGALISDYAPGTPPDSVNFPPRNRIISGLAVAVVIIEAGETSGALITATFAAEQGRDVFSVPGPIYAPQSKGTNRLIQQGARPLLKPEEVLEVLNIQQVQEFKAVRLAFPLDPVEEAVMAQLSKEPIYIDEIQIQSGLSIDKVSATLAMMELKGLVRHVGGMSYVLLHEPKTEYRTESHV